MEQCLAHRHKNLSLYTTLSIQRKRNSRKKISKRRGEGGLDLVNIRKGFKSYELIKAYLQKPETNNVFEVGLKQRVLYGKNV